MLVSKEEFTTWYKTKWPTYYTWYDDYYLRIKGVDVYIEEAVEKDILPDIFDLPESWEIEKLGNPTKQKAVYLLIKIWIINNNSIKYFKDTRSEYSRQLTKPEPKVKSIAVTPGTPFKWVFLGRNIGKVTSFEYYPQCIKLINFIPSKNFIVPDNVKNKNYKDLQIDVTAGIFGFLTKEGKLLGETDVVTAIKNLPITKLRKQENSK